MFKFVTNIPIFRRLFYAFLLAAVIPGIIISILGSIFISQQTARGQSQQQTIEALTTATNASIYLPRIDGQVNGAFQFLYSSNDANMRDSAQKLIDKAADYEKKFDGALQQYQKNYMLETSPNMSQVRTTIQSDDSHTSLPQEQQDTVLQVQTKLWPAYKKALDLVINQLDSRQPMPVVQRSLNDANKLYTPLEQSWGSVVAVSEKISDQVATVGSSQTNILFLATVIAFLSTIMAVIAIGYVVNLTITRPLRHLATLTKRIAKGETAARAQLMGRDEIYMVATSMNNMLDNIVRLIQETQSQRDSLQGQVEKLVSEVSGVGEGDLRIQAEVTADALGVLADSFNYMVEELGSLVVRVKMVASEVEKSTTSILDRMTQLVENADGQINQMTEAAIEVERMSSSSRQVAERSQVLYDVARIARQDAQVGREAVQQAIEGMGRTNENVQATASKVQNLGERSREINEVVEVISSIAHQTNRLALDAAIQAAMAGENGKGFGAVAADIRRLAERAKDQASLITRIVRSVRDDIGAVAVSMQDTERETSTGAKLTQEAGVALESIFAAVEHQAHEIESINQMAVQQLQSSSAVVQIMHGVSESTQQSSASTREASQNMERLARLVEQLRASVEAFKLREDQGYYAPNANLNMSIEEDMSNPLTVSGVFRTVSATAQPTQLSGVGAPSNGKQGTTEEVFPFHPGTPLPPSQQLPMGREWFGAEQNGPNGNSGVNW
ncbi:HAMP domain-containing protein [Ktedonosporobacter rubrisoli]|uniref:HAMP domain-containing protein n=1 Tax=Ktedonosporobacter rubrisoli TaxID=2509675 RepID=A0A4P6JX92_KTERU|nr:methyl-accepting chemotaxis protein [Ktedonosporobacter rubrisoli]QBD80135.1 HAMP domain-containing protein [Ktedonosporobacter rubrisoli]